MTDGQRLVDVVFWAKDEEKNTIKLSQMANLVGFESDMVLKDFWSTTQKLRSGCECHVVVLKLQSLRERLHSIDTRHAGIKYPTWRLSGSGDMGSLTRWYTPALEMCDTWCSDA
jgi:hypothetical protein